MFQSQFIFVFRLSSTLKKFTLDKKKTFISYFIVIAPLTHARYISYFIDDCSTYKVEKLSSSQTIFLWSFSYDIHQRYAITHIRPNLYVFISLVLGLLVHVYINARLLNLSSDYIIVLRSYFFRGEKVFREYIFRSVSRRKSSQ